MTVLRGRAGAGASDVGRFHWATTPMPLTGLPLPVTVAEKVDRVNEHGAWAMTELWSKG